MNYVTFDGDGNISQIASAGMPGAIEMTAEQLAERRIEIRNRKRSARYEAEASVYDLADAETKLASPDPAMQAEGAAQKAAVLAQRIQIKLDLP